MTKVYLLLRNNKQSGPHSIEELLKLGLKPLDLIWVEGKSYGWSYPGEIPALKSYVTAPAQTSAGQQSSEKKPAENKYVGESHRTTNEEAYMPAEKQASANTEQPSKPKVYVSMPVNLNRPVEKPQETKKPEPESSSAEMADKIERKAEEIRKRLQSYTPGEKQSVKTEEPVVTKYSSTLPEREEAYTSWIYNQKVNKSNRFAEIQKNWGAIAIAALLILVVGYGVSQYGSNDKKEVEMATSAAAPVTENKPEPLITEPETLPATQPLVDNSSERSEPERSIENAGVSKAEPPRKAAKKEIIASEKKPLLLQKKTKAGAEQEAKATVNKPVIQKDVAPRMIAETKVPEVKTVAKKDTEATVANTKKKKTLNEKVDAFFSKFSKKLEDKPAVETAPTTPAPAAGGSFPGTAERKAVHRDDKQVAATPPAETKTNLADFVQVTANKPSENWMLGVHGLKVSLRNTGNETVKTAEVELRYYTEQNEVLEKKIVNFNNILPGKTVTLPAPDHRLADHADFRLVTAK